MGAGGSKFQRRKQFVDGSKGAAADERQRAAKPVAHSRQAKPQGLRNDDSFRGLRDINDGPIDIQQQSVPVEIKFRKPALVHDLRQLHLSGSVQWASAVCAWSCLTFSSVSWRAED